MNLEELRETLARNLSRLMAASADLGSANALAKRSHVAQTTISNYLREDYVGAPQLDILAKLSRPLGVQVWQLLHPDLGETVPTAAELDAIRALRKTFRPPDRTHQQ